MELDYNKTVNLPQTEFPMRASLPKREPEMLEAFRAAEIYEKLMEKNAEKPKFILHDGPPYANGNIHIGTALNKILKDIIVREKNMAGFCAPYVPGWDTHGLPIESAILKDKKVKRDELTTAEFRDKCKDYALDFVDRQREQFMRLGGIGDWANPYITLDKDFEATQIEVFGAMAEKGFIYKGLKPVYWCPHDETALAEAEIEYADDLCESIYVKFKVADDHGKLTGLCELANTYFVIWTTTTWTLPGNLAISLNAEFEYILMKAISGETYIVAKELAPALAKTAQLGEYEVLATLKGSDFDLMTAQHPFMDRTSLILNGDHVTLEAGTGCVHTAPGFGAEDFAVCHEYDKKHGTHIGVVVPVSAKGVMTDEAGPFAGLYYSKANEAILENLTASGALLAGVTFTHPYPHCWRCKQPIIYRATEQWFCSVDAIKKAAVEACNAITWRPDWGKERMTSMISERNDWCISRQRVWGVPIPIFYCDKCGKDLVTPATIARTAELFRAHGSNVWFEKTADELVPEGFACPHCGHTHFTKETDIMDVWFDSGSTHAAVLDARPELSCPADLYLEGGDQYRGWFQSSMLTSIATKGVAPYRQIVTHGWTVDGEGKAMHKSLGNAMPPEDIIKDYGADMLRLWVASADYTQDMRISKDIMKQLSDAYLKIRNTARYMLSNLAGFDPNDCLPLGELQELDRFALSRLNDMAQRVHASYESYEFHGVYRAIYNFCVVDLSNFYLDIIKDRLYCEGPNSPERRAAQTALYRILDGLARMLAPILAFTSEEIWKEMPHDSTADTRSVLLNDLPQFDETLVLAPEQGAKWAALVALRADVNKALELARAEKIIGKSLEAKATLYLDEAAQKTWDAVLAQVSEAELETLCILSKIELVRGKGAGYAGLEFAGLTVAVAPAGGEKCVRCWMQNEHIGEQAAHPALCPRCARVVSAL